MRLTIDELRACFDLLVSRAETNGIEEIDPGERDLYWTVLADDWLNFQEQPAPAVGSLDDDLSALASLLQEPSRASSCDLKRLAAALRLLAVLTEKIVTKTKVASPNTNPNPQRSPNQEPSPSASLGGLNHEVHSD